MRCYFEILKLSGIYEYMMINCICSRCRRGSTSRQSTLHWCSQCQLWHG